MGAVHILLLFRYMRPVGALTAGRLQPVINTTGTGTALSPPAVVHDDVIGTHDRVQFQYGDIVTFPGILRTNIPCKTNQPVVSTRIYDRQSTFSTLHKFNIYQYTNNYCTLFVYIC